MADSKNTSGLATAGMVLGIIAIVGAWIPFLNVVSIILGALALVFGIIALVKKKSLGKSLAAIILGGLSVIVAIVMIAVASSAINELVKSDGANTNTSQGDQAEVKSEYAIGETATFDGKTITVTNVQRNFDTGNQFAQPETGKEFVVVTVDIANSSDSTLDYNAFEFKMQDSNGVQQTESIMALSEGKLNSGSLAKGGTVTGKLAYEVPQGDTGLKLLYQSLSLFNNEAIAFKLQ